MNTLLNIFMYTIFIFYRTPFSLPTLFSLLFLPTKLYVVSLALSKNLKNLKIKTNEYYKQKYNKIKITTTNQNEQCIK